MAQEIVENSYPKVKKDLEENKDENINQHLESKISSEE